MPQTTLSPALQTVRLDDAGGALVLLDQTLLPNEIKYISLKTQEEIHEAIRELRVRGAPAIGVAAAFGLYLAAKNIAAGLDPAAPFDAFYQPFQQAKVRLSSARPTAVNLFWALDRMEACACRNAHLPVGEIVALLRAEAREILEEDERVCMALGENGLSLLKPGMGLLTHCNAGALATAGIGTATAPMYLGHQRGYNFRIFADETRPLLQGARLTAFELASAGMEVTLICDNMVSSVMKNGWVNAVLVGCDRVAANGDAANKIGTSGVAILAKHYNIPFYVFAPTSTIDLNSAAGSDIHIELREPQEVTEKWYARPMAPRDVKVYNPAFDVTDHELITAIITEHGIVRPDYVKNLPLTVRR
ncbi:MAG: S-methyl-5-thioribose-1-phosphate isomerase [Chloroflexi bacterium]|nr:S-methyl-5-thioribose-1-phosphate isomerase [Chloroflexota bacterium]